MKKNLIVPGSLNLCSGTVFFYLLNNNLSYTQLTFAFVPQKDFYYVDDDTDFFLVFFYDTGFFLDLLQ